MILHFATDHNNDFTQLIYHEKRISFWIPFISHLLNMPKLNILKSTEVKKRIFVNGKQNCSITLKDHNPNFQNNPALRLLNPAKNELGRISETILDKTSVIDYILIDGKTHKKLLIGLKAYTINNITSLSCLTSKFYSSVSKEPSNWCLNFCRNNH